MRQYGYHKATEFTKKQINVIYAKAKKGELKVEKWIANRFYDLADYYGYDDNRSVEDDERTILAILNNVFAGELETAQAQIDCYTKNTFNLLSRKGQQRVNRELVA